MKNRYFNNNKHFTAINENYINNQYFGLYKPIKWVYMITKKQLKIFEVFAEKPFAEYTRSEIKKESKEKSNNALALAVNKMKAEGVIIEKKVGKSGILKFNLDNDKAICYIALCNIERINHIAKLSLERVKKEIEGITNFYSLVVFGSYAEGKENKDSDLDVAVFIEEEKRRKVIEASMNSAKLKSPLELDVHVISKSEMMEMLKDKHENLGKQIARKHLAIYNHAIFYELIRESMNNGFQP